MLKLAIGTKISRRLMLCNVFYSEEIDAMLGTKFEETRVYQEAKQEGREEERQAIALKMLQENISLETIAEVTGLSIEQIQELQSQVEQNRS